MAVDQQDYGYPGDSYNKHIHIKNDGHLTVINRWSVRPEAFRQVRYFPDSSLIKSPDFLPV